MYEHAKDTNYLALFKSMEHKVSINGHKQHEICITQCAVTTKLVSQEPCLKLKTGKRVRSCLSGMNSSHASLYRTPQSTAIACQRKSVSC